MTRSEILTAATDAVTSDCAATHGSALALEVQDEAILAIAAGVNPKDAIGALKPGLSHLPPGPLYEVAQAFDNGARKYGAFNWRTSPVLAGVYHDAAKRHIDSWFHGSDTASDSGVHHLAHAVACLLILLDARQQGTLRDDRPRWNVPLDEILARIGRPGGSGGEVTG